MVITTETSNTTPEIADMQVRQWRAMSPAEKLALAYSGWVVGAANATTDLGNAVRWWQSRWRGGGAGY